MSSCLGLYIENNLIKKNNNYGEEIVLFEYSNEQIAEESCQEI